MRMTNADKLSNGWKIVKLGDYCDIFNGKTPSKEEQRENGYPILKVKDIDESGLFVGKFDSFVDEKFFDKNKSRCLRNGDTIILNAAHNSEYVGSKKCYISDFQNGIIPTGEWLVIRSNSELLDNRFKNFLLISSLFKLEIKMIVKGIHLYPKDVKNLKIPLPPIPVQRRIVSILEKAEETRQMRSEADELTGKFLQAVFLEMFGDPIKNEKGWEKKPVSEVCDINPSKSEIMLPKDSAISFLPMQSVTEDGYIINPETRPISEVLTGFTYFKDGDVLFAKITPCMENGKGTIARKLKNGVGFGSTEFHVLRPKIVTSEWLYFLLSFRFIREIASKNMTGSAGQKRVSRSFFENLNVGIPPIKVQQKFASIVEKVEAMRSRQKESRQEIENLFNALMQKAFKGELVA